MAIDFPSDPSHGDVFGAFTYDENVPGWRSTPESASGMPAGSIMAWGSDTPPTNWLICNGSAVSRTTYASLFAAVGVTYGVGDGATTFNLPDLRGKVPVGKDSTQSEFDILGETGGNKSQAKYGDGTTTGYGATYSSSLGAGDSTGSNLPPYQVVQYIIKFSAGVSAGDTELATRLGVVENKFNTGQNDVPAGSITQFAGSTIPTNWLLCDGSAVARATWPSLYSAIGTTYGAGDGSTTFNLPDIPNGDSAGIISTLRINSQVTITTTNTDLSGITSTVNLKAGRTYRNTFSSPNLNMSNTGRARFDFLANGTLISRDYVGVAAGIGGVAFNLQPLFTPSADGSYVLKVAGMVDAGTATTMTVYGDSASTTLFNVEDMGESAGSSLRTKSIIKATAGVATNESAFVTRVGAVETRVDSTETVNSTQNTRLSNLETAVPTTAWTAYTPSLSNITIGNGSMAFYYQKIGRTVSIRGIIIFGTTSSFGGACDFSHPAGSSTTQILHPMGYAEYYNGGLFHGRIVRISDSWSRFVVSTVSGVRLVNNELSNTSPFTWGNGYWAMVNMTYEAAA